MTLHPLLKGCIRDFVRKGRTDYGPAPAYVIAITERYDRRYGKQLREAHRMTTTPTLNIHPGWLRPRVAVRPEPVPFPVLVRSLRMKRDLSQAAFAVVVGLDHRTISALELGNRAATLPVCIRIATGLDLDTRERVKLIESAGFLLTPEGE